MGRATAHLFADEGAHVAVTDRSEDAVAAVVREITDAGGSAHGWAMDVTDGARVRTGDRRGRGALRRSRHPRQQRRPGAPDADRRAGLRAAVGDLARRAADGATPAPCAPRCRTSAARTRAHRQHLLDRGLRRDAVRERLHRRQARRHRPHARARRRARPGGHHRQLHLSRPDPHRHHRRHPRGGEEGVRAAAAPSSAATASRKRSRTRRSRWCCRRRRSSPGAISWSTGASRCATPRSMPCSFRSTSSRSPPSACSRPRPCRGQRGRHAGADAAPP